MVSPIGLLDSGVGGLSVASRILDILPNEEILYFGDTANLPYGEKSPQQIKEFVFAIIDFFVRQNVKAVVMACNSSTAIALDEAKIRYSIPVIGVIDSGIEEALRLGNHKEVGLFANSVTVASGAHQKALTRISGNGVRIVGQACPKLVPLVENGQLACSEADIAVKEYLNTISNSNADTLILGCTHYPFLEDTIKKIAGDGLKIINPAHLTARTLQALLTEKGLLNPRGTAVNHRYFVSGDPEKFRILGSSLLGKNIDRVETSKITLTVAV